MYKDKEKKKIILIVIGVILISALIGFVVFMISKKDTNKGTTTLQSILNDSLEIKAIVDSDKSLELISFKNKDGIDKVKIWVFSEPVFLGEFNLVKKDNKYYLEGLNDILKKKSLKVGSHRLLVMHDDKSLGYIKIEINDDKSLKSTTLSQTDDNNVENIGTDEATGEEENSTTDNSKNELTKSENNKQEEANQPTVSEEPKQEEVKCTPKKFKNRYTYFYEDKDTCVKNGDQIDAWNYFSANGIPATVYGCEEIVDECGNTYYGVYYGNTEGERFYY